MIYVYLFWRCHNANAEMNRTSKICSKIIYMLPENSAILPKIKWLRKEYVENCPQITAANIFVMNNATFFSLLGSLASGIIILIQMSS